MLLVRYVTYFLSWLYTHEAADEDFCLDTVTACSSHARSQISVEVMRSRAETRRGTAPRAKSNMSGLSPTQRLVLAPNSRFRRPDFGCPSLIFFSLAAYEKPSSLYLRCTMWTYI